ncbi:MAG TPA: putative LPS assembly protein LptD [Candidatus Saccharimonadales bacterium]|nr:putative LPS assembly protein LptD [Candidatus Saccharimonadales bacterium]
MFRRRCRRPGRPAAGGRGPAAAGALAGAALLLLGLLARPGAAPAEPNEDEPLHVTADQAEGSKDFTTLLGHVVLRQGTVTLTGESAFYDKVNHHQNLTGHVHYTDQTLSITSQVADYYDQERKAILTGGVFVTDTSGTVQASRATYYRREGRLVLEGDVHANDRDRSVTAQRLTYYRDTRDALAEGNVVLEDHENSAVLATPRVFYNRETRVLRAPEAADLRLTDQGKVTAVRSDSLSYDGRAHVAYADGRVHITRDSLVAESGKAVLYRDQKRALLTIQPQASDRHGSTAGDTLLIFWNDTEVRRLEARARARVEYRSQPSPGKEEVSEATGDWLALDLKDQKARSLSVHGGVKNSFSSRNLSSQEEDVNTAEGDSMTVYFQDSEARLATVYGARAGRYQYHPGLRKGKTAEDVKYVAERIDYDLDRDKVYLRDEAHMEYKDLVLTADSVDYDMKRAVLVARGAPRLKDPSQDIQGQEMGYDLKHQQGSVKMGRTAYANGYYTGEDIKKVGDSVLNVHGGDYTTCDDPEPHYRIHSSHMKIYLHDRVVLRPVVFYLKDLPVLALPFYVFPIKEGRHSGILFPQFDLGFNSQQGRFIRNAGYYWAMNDYADVALYGDYYEAGPRWVGYVDTRYAVRYLLNGQVSASLSKDLGNDETQWQFSGTHQHQLGERTALSISADFISDAAYLQDLGLGRPPETRVSRNLHSLLALSHSWGGGSLSLALDRNQNLAVDPTDSVSSLKDEQLPTLQVNFSSFPLGRAPDANGKNGRLAFLSSTYLSYSARVAREVHQTRKFLSDRSALGGTLGLNDNRRLLGWLNMSPRFSLTHALVDQDALGNKGAMGAVWSAGIGMSTTLYGAFQPHWGPFEGIRHVLSPSISYLFQPEFRNLTYLDTAGVRQSRFPGVAGVGLTATRQSRMNLSVDNTFQLKVKSGQEIKRLDNFANLNLTTGYNFLAREQTPASEPVRPWDPVSASLRVSPGGVSGLDLNATYDPYRRTGRSISQLSFSTSFLRTGRLSFAPPGAAPERRPGGPAVGDTTGAEAIPPLGVQRTGGGPGSVGAPAAGAGSGNWSLSLAYSYGGSAYLDVDGRSVWSQTQRLNSHITYQLSPNWSFDYSNQYDLNHGLAVYQEFDVSRQLHCWEAHFSRRMSPGQSEYYLRISVKNRPEISWQSGSAGLGGLLGSGSPFGGIFGQ